MIEKALFLQRRIVKDYRFTILNEEKGMNMDEVILTRMEIGMEMTQNGNGKIIDCSNIDDIICENKYYPIRVNTHIQVNLNLFTTTLE